MNFQKIINKINTHKNKFYKLFKNKNFKNLNLRDTKKFINMQRLIIMKIEKNIIKKKNKTNKKKELNLKKLMIILTLMNYN